MQGCNQVVEQVCVELVVYSLVSNLTLAASAIAIKQKMIFVRRI